jgi:hypothetical protein
MLHKAGFTVRTGIPFPSIFNDIYKWYSLFHFVLVFV